MALKPSPAARLGVWLRDNPFFWLIAASVVAFALVRYALHGYMIRAGWLAEPIYNPFVKDWTVISTTLAAVPGYTYALVLRAITLPVQLSAWPAVGYGAGLLTCFSLMVACLSFLSTFSLVDKIRFWIGAALVVGASALLADDAVAGSLGRGMALRSFIILLNAGGYYVFSKILPAIRLPQRFLALLTGNALWYASLYFLGGGWPAYALWAGYSAQVPLLLTCLFAFQAAYFLPYGSLLLAVRQNINGLFAFALILMFAAGNVLLVYLESRSLWQGTLFAPNAFLVLAALSLLGLEPYQRFVEEDSNWFTQPALAKPLFAAWAGLSFCFIAWTIGTENAPLTEVVEDTVNLSIVGVSAGFLVFVLVNFGVPLYRSQRVDRALFMPYSLPFSAIMAIGATIMVIFFLNGDRFQYYQAKAGIYNAVGDGYFLRKDYQSADLYYLQSTGSDYYNFHGNYMLAQLARAKGSESIARDYLERALYTKPHPEAYLELAESHRGRGVFIEQALTLTEGRNRFPNDDRIASNLLITYLGSNLTDSVTLLAKRLSDHGISAEIQENLLAASALNKLTYPVPQPNSPTSPNRYQGARPRPEPCQLLAKQADTATMGSMASFLGLFNGMMVCPSPKISYVHYDTLIGQVEEAYREDLLYARAWAFWENGNRLQALEDMLALSRNRSLSTATYYATALAWSGQLSHWQGPHWESLTQHLYTDSLAPLAPEFNPSPKPDYSLRDVRFVDVPENKRAEWLEVSLQSFEPMEMYHLVRDFKDPVQQRIFLLTAARKYSSMVYLKSLPYLIASAKPEVAALDRQIYWNYAEDMLRCGKPLKDTMPKAALATLAPVSKASEGIYKEHLSIADMQTLLRAFPYGYVLIRHLVERVDSEPNLTQPLFDAVADAYALDPLQPFTRNAYITLARKLNLDSFAEAAEKKFQDAYDTERVEWMRKLSPKTDLQLPAAHGD